MFLTYQFMVFHYNLDLYGALMKRKILPDFGAGLRKLSRIKFRGRPDKQAERQRFYSFVYTEGPLFCDQQNINMYGFAVVDTDCC